VADNLAAVADHGWQPVGNFHVPVSAWTVDYYGPLRERLPVFRKSHADDHDAQELADMTEHEMSLMDRYSDWYGYEFFVFRRACGKVETGQDGPDVVAMGREDRGRS